MRPRMRRVLGVVLLLQGCMCSGVGETCSAAMPCRVGLCDTGLDGGYCSLPCTAALAGQWCPLSGDQVDGVCGLSLSDGGLGCGQPCFTDGGGGGLTGVRFCRADLRCVAAPPCTMDMTGFGCPGTDGICAP